MHPCNLARSFKVSLIWKIMGTNLDFGKDQYNKALYFCEITSHLIFYVIERDRNS